jgi:hypothetical protein
MERTGTAQNPGKQPRRIQFTRSQAILRLQHRLEKDAYPRIQMGLIVTLTGGAGLLFSFLLLHAGMANMALRYPLALVAAYGVFLGLLWLWLRTKVDDYFDLPDDAVNLGFPSGPSGGSSGGLDISLPSFKSGGGGNFGGGGASASFDDGDALPAPIGLFSSGGSSSSSSSSGLDLGDIGDADELAIPLIVIALVIGLACASFYVVYMAPALFAELLVDSAFSAALYRKMRGVQGEYWLTAALRRTALPFALTAVFLCAVGYGLAAVAPGAHSIGEVLHGVPELLGK